RQDARGLRIAATLPQASRLQGRLGQSQLKLAASGMTFAYPGTVNIKGLDVVIGNPDSATHLTAADFSVVFGQALQGRFADAEAMIGPVPLLLTRGSGSWSYADSVLSVAGEEWLLRDRTVPGRFQPLLSRDMALTLADGRITASGRLREPQTGAEVVRVAIAHDLATVNGQADLFVDGIRFDEAVRPEMLSNLVLGMVANTRGQIKGTGRIDWNDSGVTASTGRFRTDSLNFAAAFGPVTGLSGEIEFTDLLGMVSAPGQSVHVAEINTGVAAYDGIIRYRLLPDFRLAIEGGEWPFAGGRLRLDPGTIDMVTDQPRALTFRLVSVDAAEFLRRFEFDNFNATGHFSGALPIVFDKDGGHIRGGRLDVDEGGGTLAYVGELTYEDMGAMANFAFRALRSLAYTNLVIEMDGDLDGEMITKVQFDGISQGAGASRNFLTRQIEKLPIKFNVTITAPFLQLMTSTRSLYDTNFITDPALFGILPGQTPAAPASPDPEPPPPRVREPDIQPAESETMR
uniref:YdbH domain-containing protein n=1 Tax=Blastomonas sp. TaxID=1909299 RepID=UPI003593BBCD